MAWKSTRQRSRGNSTTDSELIAVNTCARRCKGLANVHREIFPEDKVPVRLYQDNTSTIKRTNDATTLGQYKEVDAKDKYVVQLIKNSEAKVIYLPTTEQVDPLTKPLDTGVFQRHRMAILQSISDLLVTETRKLTAEEWKVTCNKEKHFTLEEVEVSKDNENYHGLNTFDNQHQWGGGVKELQLMTG